MSTAAVKETAPAGGRRAGAVLGSVHSPATGTRLSQEFQGTKGSNRFRGAYLQAMPSKPIELPPTVAKAFVQDMLVFHHTECAHGFTGVPSSVSSKKPTEVEDRCCFPTTGALSPCLDATSTSLE